MMAGNVSHCSGSSTGLKWVQSKPQDALWVWKPFNCKNEYYCADIGIHTYIYSRSLYKWRKRVLYPVINMICGERDIMSLLEKPLPNNYKTNNWHTFSSEESALNILVYGVWCTKYLFWDKNILFSQFTTSSIKNPPFNFTSNRT